MDIKGCGRGCEVRRDQGDRWSGSCKLQDGGEPRADFYSTCSWGLIWKSWTQLQLQGGSTFPHEARELWVASSPADAWQGCIHCSIRRWWRLREESIWIDRRRRQGNISYRMGICGRTLGMRVQTTVSWGSWLIWGGRWNLFSMCESEGRCRGSI